MKDFVAEFEEKQYLPLARQWIADTEKQIVNRPGLAEKIAADIEGAMERLAKLQADGLPAVSYLVISLTYTSFYFGAPKLRLDFYSGQWLLEEAIYSEYIDASAIFSHWRAHEEALTEAAKNLRAWVRPAHLERMSLQSVRMVCYWLSARIKYWILALRESAALKALQKEESFYILFGEYMDWQKAIFARQGEIDIFNCKTADLLRMREFANCRYSKKTFAGLDLSANLFRSCAFEHCVFEDVDLSDTIFEDCQFSDTVFSHTHLPGALFTNSRIKRAAFAQVRADPADEIPGKMDCYRNLAFDSCVLEDVELTDCNFAGAELTDCQATKIRIAGGDFARSDFLEFTGAQAAGREGS